MRIQTHSMNRPALHIICSLVLCVGVVGCMASDKQVVQQASQFQTGINPAVIAQPQVNDYLQQIGSRIVAAARQLDAQGVGPKTHFQDKDRSWMYQDIKFQLVNSKTVNAFTTGGHFVYIYDALFQMCKTEDELAAVMSHEYAHIYCRHVQKGTGRQEALAALTMAAGAGAQYAAGKNQSSAAYAQYAAAAAQTGGTLLEDGYSREDEAQADQYGFKFYVRAGWPPEHFADFLKDMIAAGYDKTPAILSNHPTLASRVQAAEKWAQQVKPGQYQPQPEIASPQQFAQYKQMAGQASQGMPDDQKVLAAKNLLTALPRSCWIPVDQPDQKQAQEQIIQAAKQQQAQQPSPARGG